MDMARFEDDAQNTDENSPRKLEKDILDYLLQISQQLEKLEGGSENEEEREILIENALAELSARSRTSSAMADRTTHSIMEQLVQLCSPSRLGQVLSSCLSYAVFLARNRYSSHVLQAMLSRLAFLLKQDGLDVGSAALSAASAVSSFAAPLLQSLAWLSREISASHVIRSAVCLLSGLPVVAERKGRSSKHQHSVALSEPLERLQCDEGRFFISASCCYAVPAAFHAQLMEAVGALLDASSAADLQEMACNANSSALLGLLVRIFSNGAILGADGEERDGEGAGERAESICRRLISTVLRFDPASRPGGEDVFYGLAGDSAGSFFLQAAVECAPVELLLPLISSALLLAAAVPDCGLPVDPEQVAATHQKMAEYAQDGVANFVLQSILRRLAAELSPSCSPAVKAAAEAILQAFTLTDSNPLAALERDRGGVILRLLELAKALDASSSSAAVWSEKLGLLVIGAWEKAAAPPRTGTGAGAGEGAAGAADLERYLEQRLSLRPAAAEERPGPGAAGKGGQKGKGKGKGKGKDEDGRGGAETTVLVAAKIVGALLSSSSVRVARTLAAAIARLPADTLRQVALSGQQDSSCAEFRLVTATLLSFGLELAVHCVGHHVLRQAYDRSDLRGKEKWLQLLAPTAAAAAVDGAGGGAVAGGEGEGGSLLNSKNKSIWRATQQALSVDLFLSDPGQWRTACRKSSQAGQLLKELEQQQQPADKDKDKDNKVAARGKAGASAKGPSGPSAGKKRDQDGDDPDEKAEEEAEDQQPSSSGKAPRKRKRKRSGRPADAS